MHQVTDINSISKDISKPQVDQLHKFHKTLVKWNQKINLISKSTIEESEVLHICDGIAGSQIILKNHPKKIFYDLGAGNGIPGVTFAILSPETKVTCMDSDDRKMAFIKFIKLDLNLKNLDAICARVENVEFDKDSDFMARGFAPIPAAHKFIDHHALKGSVFYHFKAEGWEKELDPNCSTWNNSDLGSYELVLKSKENPKRHIIRAEKLFV